MVTGAAGGLGRAICRLIEDEGGTAVGLDVVPDSGAVRQADVRDESSVRSAMCDVLDERGRIDVLVNNAGISGPRGPAHEVEMAEFDEVLEGVLIGQSWVLA